MVDMVNVVGAEGSLSREEVVAAVRRLINSRRGSSALKVSPESVLWTMLHGGGHGGWSWGMLQSRLGLVVSVGLECGDAVGDWFWGEVGEEVRRWGSRGVLGVGDVEERVEGWLRHLRGCKAEKGAAEVCLGALMVGLELLTQECCMQEDEPAQEDEQEGQE